MRRLIRDFMGSDALHWFDGASEPLRGLRHWRRSSTTARSSARATTGTGSTPRRSTTSSRADAARSTTCRSGCSASSRRRSSSCPACSPLFTTLAAQRDMGGQRLTFASTAAAAPRRPAAGAGRAGPGPPLAGDHADCSGWRWAAASTCPRTARCSPSARAPAGPEFEIYVLLSAIPDVPPSFLSLLTMGLAERPRGPGGARTLDGRLHPRGRALAGPLLDHQPAHRCASPRRASASICGRSSSSCRTEALHSAA